MEVRFLSEIDEVEKALYDYGYSSKAVREIMKWYESLEKR